MRKSDRIPDVCALGGLCILSAGLWRVHPPTAFIVVGAMLLLYGILAGR